MPDRVGERLLHHAVGGERHHLGDLGRVAGVDGRERHAQAGALRLRHEVRDVVEPRLRGELPGDVVGVVAPPDAAPDGAGGGSGGPGHCGATSCLHWGVRRDGEYVDPLELLEPAPVVLLPWR